MLCWFQVKSAAQYVGMCRTGFNACYADGGKVTQYAVGWMEQLNCRLLHARTHLRSNTMVMAQRVAVYRALAVAYAHLKHAYPLACEVHQHAFLEDSILGLDEN